MVWITVTALSATDEVIVFDFSATNNTGGDLTGATAEPLFGPIGPGYSTLELAFSYVDDAFGVDSFHIGIFDDRTPPSDDLRETLYSTAEGRPIAPVPLPASILFLSVAALSIRAVGRRQPGPR